MAAPLFVKRTRPGGGAASASARRPTRARSPSNESDCPFGSSLSSRTAPRTSVGEEPEKKRRASSRITLEGGDDGDDELAGDFRVKKSKLSRQMSRRGEPVPAPFLSRKRAAADDAADGNGGGGDCRRSAATGRGNLSAQEGGQTIPDSDEEQDTGVVVAGEVVEASMGEKEDQEDAPDPGAATAARLARAQRQAARELYGSKGEKEAMTARQDYIPLIPSKPVRFADVVKGSGAQPEPEDDPFEAKPELSPGAIVLARGLGSLQEEVDPMEAWVLQQMRKGSHRRHGDLSQVEAKGLAGQEAIPAPRSFAPLERKSLNGDTGVSWSDRPKSEVKLQTPSLAIAQMWETLSKIEGGVEERTKKAEELEAQRLNALDQLKELEIQERGIDKSLKSVQELEELAWSLGGLLDAKHGKLKQATQMLAQMEGAVAANRRRRRVQCLADDLANSGATVSKPVQDHEVRAESAATVLEKMRARREARRTRQQPTLESVEGHEGWETSSADEDDALEEWTSDRAALCTAAHKQILGDVSVEFASATAVLGPLKKAKKNLSGEYEKAFVPISLPEMLAMHIEHSMLWWDPLEFCPTNLSRITPKTWGPRGPLTAPQLEEFDWFGELADFSELRGDEDPDSMLVPRLVQRCVFPEVARRITDCWDVTSARQSSRVAALLDECLLFEVEDEGDKSKSSTAPPEEVKPLLFSDLLSTAFQRLEAGLAEHAPEVFVPRDEMSKWYDSKARWRLLWRSVKLAHNMLLLDGRLPDEQLSRLVLHSVFTMRVAPHLRAPRTDAKELLLMDRFTASLPRRWLESGLPPALKPLRDALGPRANVAAAAAAGPAVAEAAARVLRSIRCFDEAQVILDGVAPR